jgi:hypothetical protein
MINFNIILLDIPSGLVPSGFSNILNKWALADSREGVIF